MAPLLVLLLSLYSNYSAMMRLFVVITNSSLFHLTQQVFTDSTIDPNVVPLGTYPVYKISANRDIVFIITDSPGFSPAYIHS